MRSDFFTVTISLVGALENVTLAPRSGGSLVGTRKRIRTGIVACHDREG